MDITKIIQKEYYNCKVYLSDQNSSMVNFARDRAMNEDLSITPSLTHQVQKASFKNSFFNHVFISFGFRNFSDKR